MIKSPLYEGSFLSLSAGERYENHFDFSGIAESGTIVIFTVSKLQNAEKSTKTSERRKKTAKAFKVTKLGISYTQLLFCLNIFNCNLFLCTKLKAVWPVTYISNNTLETFRFARNTAITAM